MSDELLPCPFCDGDAFVSQFAIELWNRLTLPTQTTPPPNLTGHEARIWRYNQGEIK